MPDAALSILIAYGAICAVISVVTFVAYGLDKRAATRHSRRIPEKRLHLLALLGGWPGALVAQRLFKHKRRKRSFMTIFLLTIVLHAVLLAGAIYAAFRFS